MAWHLLLVAVSQDGSFPGIARQVVEAVALEHRVNASGRYFDVVVAFHIPNYSHWAEMVSASEMKNLLFNVCRHAQLWVLRARLAVDQSGLALLCIGAFPLVKDFSGDAEVAAGSRDVAKLLSVIKYAELSSDIVLGLSHSGPPGQNVSPLEISCQPRFRFSKLKNAGLPRSRFYDLRHSCASLLLAQGVPARTVMDILGHSQISLTMNTYAHVMPAMKQDAMDLMESILTSGK